MADLLASVAPGFLGFYWGQPAAAGNGPGGIVWSTPTPPPPVGRSYPSLFEDNLGRLHAVHAKGGIVYRRSDFSTPPFALTTQVTMRVTSIEPVVAVTPDLRVHILYADAGNVYYLYSDDDGRTFADPIVMIPGGKHPGIAVGKDGTLIFAGLITAGSGRAMMIKRAFPGQVASDAAVVSPHLYPKAVASSFQSEWTDDSFGIAYGIDNQNSLLIHGLVNVSVGGAAEAETSVWGSWDDFFTGIRLG